MKTYREQFIECSKNNVHVIKNLKEPEIIHSLNYGPVEFDTIIWCKRFNCKCGSNVCKNYRKSISWN